MTNDEFVPIRLLLGYLGIVNIILFSPIVVTLGFLDFVELQLFNKDIFGYILLTGFFDNVISDYFWARSVILTSPTVATVGLSLTIPFAIITDILSGNHNTISYVSLIGSFFVLCGSVIMLYFYKFIK
jgi:solute carrier family 35 protein F5